jgi:hypothetical protein
VKARDDGKAALKALASGGSCRGGLRAGDLIDAGRLDQRADRRSFQRSPGYGAAMAQRFHPWRGRGSQGARGAGVRSRSRRGQRFGWPSRSYPRRSPIGPIGSWPAWPRRSPAREGVTISRSQLSESSAPKRGFGLRRPRHTLKGRQDKDAVDRGGPAAQTAQGARPRPATSSFLFADESEALTRQAAAVSRTPISRASTQRPAS